MGIIEFEALADDKTLVTYTIELQARAPFVSKLILAQLQAAIKLGLTKTRKICLNNNGKSNDSFKIITIDGPSGSGKGTLAAKLAAHYQFHLLDSGALYRLLGLSLHHHDLLDSLDTKLPECVQIATNLDIQFVSTDTGVQVWLDGEDVSQTIRTERVGEFASKVAAIPELRTAMVSRQHTFAQAPGLVADGRDMATSIFPNAQAKNIFDGLG